MMSSLPGLEFPAVRNLDIVAKFDGGDLTSDAGLLLVKQADTKLGLIASLTKAIVDKRQLSKVKQPLDVMLAERVLAIALGYEDANDLDDLGKDSALKVACNRRPNSDADLASQPTISRFENSVTKDDLFAMSLVIARTVINVLPHDTTEVVLDIDATVDPCHGQQEFNFFNKYYKANCYLPLLLHMTAPGGQQWLLGSYLRSGTATGEKGFMGMLRIAVKLLRERFPKIRIVLRADSGFSGGKALEFCERQGIAYIMGFKKYSTVKKHILSIETSLRLKYETEGDVTREYGEFEHKAEAWKKSRRLIVKGELVKEQFSSHVLLTNLTESPAKLYGFYTGRGEQENRIKELKNGLCSGRTSCHRFLANQFRLLLHTAACVLMSVIQQAARGTQFEKAQVSTIRLKLLKVGARVQETSRKIWFHLAENYPYQDVWWHINQKLLQSTS